MGSTDYKFQGWLGLDKDSAKGKMVWQGFEPKPFEEDDVDIKITHCGKFDGLQGLMSLIEVKAFVLQIYTL